ncbi:putative peroxiredoxin [Amylocarpus encephaloides]|uniref:thioredoxin-dependent peroxiredoxin n=1 Tax=Amylocarpus encephaloides TaxID=45428 RepID=A0A9P7Y8R5_9HELO|nr:putative peroxiredoxin [Amylocarpus encephaloides]
MPRELRKRKAPAVEPATAPPAKKAQKKGPGAKAVAKVKEAVAPKTEEAIPAKPNGRSATKIKEGVAIDLEGFGGEIETHDGVKTTLKKLVDESKGGVVLFTYPKASTPGCTKQACQFRDEYVPLTATGFSIFGLSIDSPKANTNFKEKQKLSYTLLCDPGLTLISAIGLKKSPDKTNRGVFVVDKSGKILAAGAGSPSGTVEVVQRLVAGGGGLVAEEDEEEGSSKEAPVANGVNGSSKEDVAKAEVAAQVADTAEKLDKNEAAAA